MWIFTKYGFFSIVCARRGNGRYAQLVDPERIMVRARVRGHLEALQKRFPDLLAESVILDSVGTDYAHRLFVPKAVWARAMSALTEEIDYDNFKSKVARHHSGVGLDYEHSLHDVWSVMHRLQE
jgi:hypothetical protein